MHGNLYGSSSDKKNDLSWMFYAYEGNVLQPSRWMFQPLFWQNQDSAYSGKFRMKSSFLEVSTGFDALFYSTSNSSVKNNDIILVNKTYNSLLRGPYFSFLKNIYSSSKTWMLRPRCMVDALHVCKQSSSVVCKQSENSYYIPGKREVLSQDAVLRLQGDLVSHFFIRGMDYVWHTELHPGFVLYHKSIEKKKDGDHGFFSFRLQSSWSFPEYFVLTSEASYRMFSSVKFCYQPIQLQSDDVFQGYDLYDYRYHESLLWYQLKTTVRTCSCFGYWNFLQGVDWSDEQMRDRKQKCLKFGISFPWKSRFYLESQKAGYSLSAEGEWGCRENFLHMFSLLAWQEFSALRYEIRYVYLASELASIRSLRDIGHFGVAAVKIKLGKCFESSYQGWWQLYAKNSGNLSLRLKRQVAKIWWNFDCWRLGIGLEYEQYSVFQITKNAWHMIFSVRLLFSD